MAAVVRFCRFNCFFDAGETKVKGECIFLNSRETKLWQGAYLPEEQSFVKELIYRKKRRFDRKLIHQKSVC